ncbi:hypothetical protein DAPPUDRAFT_241238 [Daphnia pulex]|uniref:Ionotropic glutamate receptor C-terminal domain-containing protein n=1 Tax=Daphnia pulex TaxID=6669 RepID=E9GDS4_DAPPU|nr:hypothetical protein DAPPUDRAFT_241238 [Daphnia pulex]|eukprot:EFX82430.1 hypothetical protein DAPPUDRAFT_241238 [Daphnia pulex]
MVAGVWTLAAFFFVQTYTSTLITYIITPVNDPLISTVQDIVDSSDINVFIKMAGVADTLLSTLNDSGMYAKLRRRLDSSPNARCNLTSECIRLITPGSKNVYIDTVGSASNWADRLLGHMVPANATAMYGRHQKWKQKIRKQKLVTFPQEFNRPVYNRVKTTF